MVVLTSACDNQTTQPPDGFQPLDAGGDAVVAPDFGKGDGGEPRQSIGGRCNPETPRCAAGQLCLDLGGGVGVCTIGDCTLEDNETSQREDSCPQYTACAEVAVEGPSGYEHRTFCLWVCEPMADQNSCAARHPGLACAPASILATGYTEVCGALACKTDLDCNPGAPTDLKAYCNTENNLCVRHGKADAVIGGACRSSSDCGEGQYCLAEVQEGDRTYLPGGYCTRVGCRYGEPWACPEGSGCYSFGAVQAISLCLATGCDPSKEAAYDGCRDEAVPAEAYDCLAVDEEGVCWQQPK